MNPNLPMFPFIYTYVCCDWKSVVDKYINYRLGAFIFDLIIVIRALKHLWTMSWRWCVLIHVIVVANVATIVVKIN